MREIIWESDNAKLIFDENKQSIKWIIKKDNVDFRQEWKKYCAWWLEKDGVMPIKPIFCCDPLKDMYIRHKSIWLAAKGTWLMAIRDQSLWDQHTLMEPIKFCPFCGKKLEVNQ